MANSLMTWWLFTHLHRINAIWFDCMTQILIASELLSWWEQHDLSINHSILNLFVYLSEIIFLLFSTGFRVDFRIRCTFNQQNISINIEFVLVSIFTLDKFVISAISCEAFTVGFDEFVWTKYRSWQSLQCFKK